MIQRPYERHNNMGKLSSKAITHLPRQLKSMTIIKLFQIPQAKTDKKKLGSFLKFRLLLRKNKRTKTTTTAYLWTAVTTILLVTHCVFAGLGYMDARSAVIIRHQRLTHTNTHTHTHTHTHTNRVSI